MGAVTALGLSAPATMAAMREGVCAIGRLDFEDSGRLDHPFGARIRDYQAAAHFTERELALLDPFAQFAILAAREAMAQSGLVVGEALGRDCAVIMGSAGGGLQTQDASYRAVYQAGRNRVHPMVVPRLMHSAAASHLSMRHGLTGPVYSVASACAASNHAMGQAFHLIRSGGATAALTGGSESMLSFGGLKAWEGMRVMSRGTCRPFCATRDGLIQGEGAAVFVFEERRHAQARGANILAEVIGFAMNSDAGDIVRPSVDGAARAMAAALRDARTDPGEIGYINAHGTGTRVNDAVETAAIRRVLGPHADHVPVSSTKAMHGHLIGGTGAVELLACIMALREGVIAPTANHVQADPDCNLDVVPNLAREARVKVAMSNAFAFGGLNAVLVLGRA